ncbi:hypothetical protein J2810_002521 [Chryseobacterium rhizosphaerae]|uniref:hypothetical protein n=1 Tax=Chryseobacterium rhizosphaerae TaxID=395937 RepID=UPI002866E3F8|nr:hypothetical protein [Chryseobacterium rhizosphaerae]MDR6546462.1 hypothetical protein [Chryseobacterium rhizosphaerae]
MKNNIDTEYQALCIISELIKKFGLLHVLNISEQDSITLKTVRDELEKIIQANGYRMNYDKNIKNTIIKL